MDGNGRWARRLGFERLRGHEKGANSLRRITRYCRAMGIPEVTFFALSTENYLRRPRREVNFLLKLLKSYLISERDELTGNDIRLKAIGHMEGFPDDVKKELAETMRLTAEKRGMVLRLALNYGSRQEILESIGKIADDLLAGRIAREEVHSLGERGFKRYLNDPEMSDPDLLIRTAGEFRLSNFLLWQCSYAEIWVTSDLWPDFDVPRLEEALADFCSRERKYGGIDPAERKARLPGAQDPPGAKPMASIVPALTDGQRGPSGR
jgi:undecaprenyl diphosphate synthase